MEEQKKIEVFTVEKFLDSAKIKKERIPIYIKFLNTWGLEEFNLSLLTREELERFEIKYKTNPENKDFILVPADAAAIAEAALNWGKKS